MAEDTKFEAGSMFPLLQYDPTEGMPIPCLPMDERTALAVLTVPQLLNLVLDPIASQDPRRIATDPILASYGALRIEVQRLVEGAKAKNAVRYGNYIVGGLKGEHPWISPPVTLYHQAPLKQIRFPGGMSALIMPFGHYFVAIDGETQRIAWQRAANDYPLCLERKVGVVIHHGKNIDEARQGFYDLNLREVKPSAAVAIAMDTHDPATRITRAVIEASPVFRDRVHFKRRQLRRKDPEILTLSALRTGIVTTILGTSGLQAGSRPIDLPPGTDRNKLKDAVVNLWVVIADNLKDELDPVRRATSVVSAPSILAGIGIVAHHAMPEPPRNKDVEEWTVDEVIDRLEGVVWDRLVNGQAPWEGIAGKLTSRGRFSIGGPKELGHAVADALQNPSSETGKRIRPLR